MALALKAEGAKKRKRTVTERTKGVRMTQKHSRVHLSSIETVTRNEAEAYLASARGDELEAAMALAIDRNLLAGSNEIPDEADVHQALYLFKRAFGEETPSYDSMRVELKKRHAA